MSYTDQQRLEAWDAFLKRWPIEAIQNLTLEEYVDVSNEDTLAYWLEHKTKILGSIRGGDSSKFGIYKRNKPPKGERAHIQHGEAYSWNKKFGSTEREAFESVKNQLLDVHTFVKAGELEQIESLGISDTLKWKFAFLNQDRDHPVLVGIYQKQMLESATGITKAPRSKLYKNLMQNRGDTDIITYGRQIWSANSTEDEQEAVIVENDEQMKSQVTVDKSSALNTILYGSPGTGKTYSTIDKALEIIEPEFYAQNKHDREALKKQFDKQLTANRIGFVTFHQSFSYEDFVEGLKADSDNGALSYSVEPGIFKSICERAISSQSNTISVDDFESAVLALQEQFEESDDRIEMETIRGKKFEIEYTGGTTFKVFPHSTESTDPKYVASITNVRKLYLTGSKQGIYNSSYIAGFLLHLKRHFGLKEFTGESLIKNQKPLPYVLIIDEINRGNIANIFGELITLLEPSKRAGGDESLTVKLPYSKEQFSVPSNLHIIGTMNTADKSLAQLDIALRRRFKFIEMMPRYDVLADIPPIDGINVAFLLKAINERIELLYDREHTIGHSFFMPLKDNPTIEKLAEIFELEILPLLEEYFFEDWERVSQVLGDHIKPSNSDLRFIQEKFTEKQIESLMGKNWQQQGIQRYQRNQEALTTPEAYLGVYTTNAETAE